MPVSGLSREVINSIAERNFHNVFYICLQGLVVYFVIGVCQYLNAYFLPRASNGMGMEIRRLLFSRLINSPFTLFAHRRVGDLMSRVIVDVKVIEDIVPSSIERLVSSPFVALFLGVGLFLLNWQLALFSALVLPLLGFLIDKAGKKMRMIQIEIQKRLAELNTALEQSFSFIKEIKGLCAEKFETERFRELTSKTFGAIMRGVRLRALLSPSIQFAGAVGVIGLILFSSWQMLRGVNFDVGKLTQFVILLSSIYQNIRGLGEGVVGFQQALGASARLIELLELSAISESKEGEKLPTFSKELSFENVSFGYDGSIKVLEGINFNLKKGEVIAIVGPSGAGKTTLIDLVPRFYDPIEGRVVFDGKDIREADVLSLRHQIAIVSQEPFLFAGTIRENLSYPEQVSENEMKEVLKQVALWEFVSSLPSGLDTVIGERGVTLSAGQRQRLAIARALLRKPQILILDEATASLDSAAEQHLLDNISKGRYTVILVAHRLSTARVADRIIVLNEGKIVEEGTHEELLEKGGLYATLYKLQIGSNEKTDRETL